MNAAHAPIFDFLVHIMLARCSKTLIFLYFQKLRYLTSAFDRPAFQEMMNDIVSGKINCVIVKDLSRLGWEYIETGRYLRPNS
jgi:DNA invertase Pin-like site-specific DNA recombinase